MAVITHPGGHGGLRFLHKVPGAASQPNARPAAEVLVDGTSLLDTLGLLAHLLEHVLLALVVAVLAARLEVELVDAPVLEVVGERQHAHLLDEVQLTGPVEVQHRRERTRVSIEVELHRVQAANTPQHVPTVFALSRDAAMTTNLHCRQGRRQVKICGVDRHGERGAQAYNGGLGRSDFPLP